MSQSHSHTPKGEPELRLKWPQSYLKVARSLSKIIKINGENKCFSKMDLHIPKVTPQWSQSHPYLQKSTQSHFKMLPKPSPWKGPFGLTPHLSNEKTFKNQHFFNISAFWPHQARAYMHHACHLMSRGPFFFLFLVFRSLFLPKPFSQQVVRTLGMLLPPLTPAKIYLKPTVF